MQHLKSIDLSSTKVSTGFQHLANCPSLETLLLDGTEVDDDAIRDIAKIVTLKGLYVGSENVTNDGLRFLAGHPNLETLYYHGIGPTEHLGITEECFEHLPKIPQLRDLSVACRVTAKGLESLQRISKLDTLCVDWPTLTLPELEAIRQHLPNCRVRSLYVNE